MAAAKPYLRRALEARLDLGRHLLSKGFARPTDAHKQVARGLGASRHPRPRTEPGSSKPWRVPNRMVHFYSEVTGAELFVFCARRTSNIEDVLRQLLDWVRDHPEKVDDSP